ncbi:GntR family transcriptional regulator [Rhizobiales bacterium GAS191]|jgi:GntR family transcriptional regulator|nr:GntR family transcriptional regulator [Rhizobiales bacterium GAS113]SEC95608.1 GntR family transcriptional regulator [Rhizobiales bacterium GAS191]
MAEPKLAGAPRNGRRERRAGESEAANRDIYRRLAAAIDFEQQTPRYFQLATAMRHAISSGALRAGEAIESERRLATLTGMSRVTIRHAIEELLREGMLSRRHGSGTYVAERIDQPLSMLSSFTEDVRMRGGRAGSIWISRETVPPTPHEAFALGLRPNKLVVRLRRVRTANNEPLAIENAVVPAELLPSPELVTISLYAALAKLGHRPATGVQRLQATLASIEEAKLLGVLAGSAILRIERRGFLANGRPVEFTTSAYRGDRYDFVATLTTGAAVPGPGAAE